MAGILAAQLGRVVVPSPGGVEQAAADKQPMAVVPPVLEAGVEDRDGGARREPRGERGPGEARGSSGSSSSQISQW